MMISPLIGLFATIMSSNGKTEMRKCKDLEKYAYFYILALSTPYQLALMVIYGKPNLRSLTVAANNGQMPPNNFSLDAYATIPLNNSYQRSFRILCGDTRVHGFHLQSASPFLLSHKRVMDHLSAGADDQCCSGFLTFSGARQPGGRS
jgi:hypothetical protein